MAQRRFGPTRGAGVAIVEKEGEQQIEPGALGWAGYAGLLEKGNTGELLYVQNKTEFAKKCGGIIDDGQLPDAADDYYSLANGAGGLLLVRVTDGNEVAASRTLYQRNGDVLTPMGTVAAKNGGRWGGAEAFLTDDLDAIGDLLNTTLQLPAAIASNYTTDQWKGGYIELADVPNARYPITGNTDTGLITVASDQTMLDDYNAAAGASLRFYIVLESENKEVSVILADGEDNPGDDFSLEVLVDGAQIKKYANLNTDPASPRYWVDIINDDDGNDEITVADLITGAHTATQRPANHYGKISAVTALVLTAEISDFVINSPGGGDPTFAFGTTADEMLDDTLTITMTAPTTGTVVSSRFGALGTVTLGTLFDPPNAGGGAVENKWAAPFTITAGGSPLAAADVLIVHYKPFRSGALVGGLLFPDKVNNPLDNFRIASNTHSTITVAAGDLTTIGAIGEYFMLEAAQPLAGGRDGNADVGDTEYIQQAWDTDLSPFNQIFGQNLGLVKFATPGVTATAVAKAGAAYAVAKNHQYRHEIPSNIVTENGALNHINNTIGRTEYSRVNFPSYGYVPDPDPEASRAGKLKLITLTGMTHGREARIAADFNGYHKAEAGTTATLPRLLKLPTGDKILNEEVLNPAGIGIIKKKTGNFILWGDRTLHLDTNWRFAHQRELMSYYEHVLQESFDFIIFSINDPQSDKDALTALKGFFLPEWVKRALRGDTFEEAAIIKVDSEINTDAVRAAGDKKAEVSLKLADTTERFEITIGKQGIFENVA